MDTIAGPAAWAAFLAVVLGMLALDLGVFHRRSHVVKFREAMTWSVVWIGVAAIFGVVVWQWQGATKGLEFATGYVLEKALSVDNLFVMLVILQRFRVPEDQRHKVLFWGVIGALVLRAIFIVLGAALVTQFHWVLYGFGVLLIITAIQMVRSGPEKDPTQGRVVKWFSKILPLTAEPHEGRFFIKQAGKTMVTSLFLALVAVEVADLMFAVDSIPAVFAVTRDPFIVFTSNVLAILGLRSLFFALSGLLERFHLLKYGLAGVLCFVGVKMLVVDLVKVPVGVSLGVVGGLLALTMVVSWLRPPRAPMESNDRS